MSKKWILIFGLCTLLLTNSGALAQDATMEPHFAIETHVGGSAGFARWTFHGLGEASVVPGLSIGAAVKYTPLIHALGDVVNLSIETGLASMSASTRKDTQSAEWSISRTPIMAWCALQSDGRLAPFVRLGIGYAYTHFKESYSRDPKMGVDFGQWDPAWGISGGLKYYVSGKFELGLCIEDWITEEAIVENNQAGIRRGISGHFVFTSGGLLATYHF